MAELGRIDGYVNGRSDSRQPGVNPCRCSLAKQLSLALRIPEYSDDDGYDDLSITRRWEEGEQKKRIFLHTSYIIQTLKGIPSFRPSPLRAPRRWGPDGWSCKAKLYQGSLFSLPLIPRHPAPLRTRLCLIEPAFMLGGDMWSTKSKISRLWRVNWRRNKLRVATNASQLCHKWSLNG